MLFQQEEILIVSKKKTDEMISMWVYGGDSNFFGKTQSIKVLLRIV